MLLSLKTVFSIILATTILQADVAQLVEQLIRNQ